jgi:hypothetical protein
MNRQGYELWTSIIKAVLLDESRRHVPETEAGNGLAVR